MTVFGWQPIIGPQYSQRLALNSDSSGYGSAWMQRLDAPAWPVGKHYEVGKLGFWVKDGRSDNQARMALYSGDANGPVTLIAEAYMEHGDDNFHAYEEVVSSSGTVPESGYLWVLIKGKKTSASDDTSTSYGFNYHPSGVCYGLSNCDWTENAKYVPDLAGADGTTSYPSTWTWGSLTDFGLYTLSLWVDLVEVAGAPPVGTADGQLPSITADAAGYLSIDGDAAGTFPELVGNSYGDFVEVLTPATTASVIHYKAILSASGEDDYEIPISSFEMRLRPSPKQCYLAVVIPAILSHASAIAARSGGELAIYQTLDGQDTEMLTANVDGFRQYEGSGSRSGSITAYKQKTFGPFKTRSLAGATYRYSGDGITRYRMAPREIFPGDTGEISGDYVNVVEVVWSIGTSRASMEIVSA